MFQKNNLVKLNHLRGLPRILKRYQRKKTRSVKLHWVKKKYLRKLKQFRSFYPFF